MNCKNCETPLTGKYCSNCGQKKFDPQHKTVSHLFHDVFHFLTHLEGNIFKTFKTIFTKPGKYALDYSNGIQKRYFKPISLFLVIVIIYLLFPFMQGLNMKMKNHESMFLYGKIAAVQIEKKIEANSSDYETIGQKYEAKSQKTSKILLLLLIPLSALFLKLLFLKQGIMAFDLLVVSTEINSVYIAFLYLFAPIIISLIGFIVPVTEFGILVVSTIIFVSYLCIIFKRFFKVNGFKMVASALVFGVSHFLIIQTIYRFILFEVTMLLV